MAIEIKCDECRKTIEVGGLCYCESCINDLQSNLGKAEDRIAELEEKLQGLKNE